MKARTLNNAVALTIVAGLVVNTLSHSTGWCAVGEILGWCAIVAGLWMAIDNKLKEREQA